MPKSKKNKIVHLTQVRKKGKDHKEDLIKQIEEYVNKYQKVYLFDFENAKGDRIMALRLRLKELGRIFSGKNSLVSFTFRSIGSQTNTDYEKFLHNVSGHKGLFFSNIECSALIDILDKDKPEFLTKLLGYAQLATVAESSDDDENDDEDGDEDENDDENDDESDSEVSKAKPTKKGLSKSSTKTTETKKMKKTTITKKTKKQKANRKKLGRVREVKFVRV